MNCTQEVRAQLEDHLQQRSPERLQVVAGFSAYLADAESEATTQELLAIPGLLDRDRAKHSEVAPKKDSKIGGNFVLMYESVLHPNVVICR